MMMMTIMRLYLLFTCGSFFLLASHSLITFNRQRLTILLSSSHFCCHHLIFAVMISFLPSSSHFLKFCFSVLKMGKKCVNVSDKISRQSSNCHHCHHFHHPSVQSSCCEISLTIITITTNIIYTTATFPQVVHKSSSSFSPPSCKLLPELCLLSSLSSLINHHHHYHHHRDS